MDMDQQQTAEENQNRELRLKRGLIISLGMGVALALIVCGVLIYLIFQQHTKLSAFQEQMFQMMQRYGEIKDILQNQMNEDAESLQLVKDELKACQDELKTVKTELDEMNQPKPLKHTVYLTFDDGPSKNTDRILDILKKYNVKATFFVLGKEDEVSKQALRRIVEEGHTLAMHSYTHKYDEIYASKEAFAEDVTKLRDFLRETTGVDCNIYRFPGGSSNTISDIDIHEFIDFLDEQNITYFDWNVSSGDAVRNPLTADEIWQNCVLSVVRRQRSVILFHDAANKDTTVEALPMIIETILEMQDTEILPLTADMDPIQHVKSDRKKEVTENGDLQGNTNAVSDPKQTKESDSKTTKEDGQTQAEESGQNETGGSDQNESDPKESDPKESDQKDGKESEQKETEQKETEESGQNESDQNRSTSAAENTKPTR